MNAAFGKRQGISNYEVPFRLDGYVISSNVMALVRARRNNDCRCML